MNKTKIINISVFCYAFILLVLVSKPLFAAEPFTPDESGVYHVTNEGDWTAFYNQMLNGEMFFGETVVLDNDIVIQGNPYDGCVFGGIFDGNSHLITYSNEDIATESAVFPIYLYGGTIKDTNIYLKDCKIDASKHDGVVKGTILASYGLNDGEKDCTVENINIYGIINVVPDIIHANKIECSGIDVGYSNVNNCNVNINYDIELDTLKEFVRNTNDLRLRIRLFQFGYSQVDKMALSKCYSLGSYSSAFTEAKKIIQKYYEDKETVGNDEFVLITAFGGDVSRYQPPSEEYCYYCVDYMPEYIFGSEQSINTSKQYFFNDESMAKTTVDLKKQETFVDYDFDNVWGISEYINEGYPFLRSLVNKDLVDIVDQIANLPGPDKITKEDKGTVEKLKAALVALSDKDKALIPYNSFTDKVAKAEEAIKEIEEKEKEDGKTQPQEPTAISVKKGTKFTIKGYKYAVTGTAIKNPTVAITGYKNKKLKKISIPATVSYKNVVFKVTSIGNNAFKNQKKATTVIVGKNVTSIGKAAFAGDKKVKKFTVKTTVLKKIGTKAFKGIHKKAVIKVPKKQVKAYKKLMKNKGQAKTVKIK